MRAGAFQDRLASRERLQLTACPPPPPQAALWADSAFLASLGVMDYSLLVGVDEGRKELVVSIIDYLRQYTWDKQLETWVKATPGIMLLAGVVGGPGTGPGGRREGGPTVISPKQYKRRFRRAMEKYFVPIPDPLSPVPLSLPGGGGGGGARSDPHRPAAADDAAYDD